MQGGDKVPVHETVSSDDFCYSILVSITLLIWGRSRRAISTTSSRRHRRLEAVDIMQDGD